MPLFYGIAMFGLMGMAGDGAGARQGRGDLPALASLEKGRWQLRDSDGRTRQICLGDPRLLLQLYHGPPLCQQVVMDSAPGRGTIRYSCAGRGGGRTTIFVETPRLISLDIQGVADGAPFSEQIEGRRIGDCS